MKSISASRSDVAAASTESTAQAPQKRKGDKYKLPGWVSAVSRWYQASAGFMTSMLIHMLVILAMVWITNETILEEGPVGLLLLENPPPPELRETPIFTPVIEQVVGKIPEPKLTAVKPVVSTLIAPSPTDSNDKESNTEISANTQTSDNTNLNQTIRSNSAGGFDGRGKEAQAQMLADTGGSQATQDAVERALAWIAAHQNREEGYWDFNHHNSPQGDTSGNAGTSDTLMGATGFALLPFLGKGYTHLNDSPYQETVRKGLYYLQTNIKLHNLKEYIVMHIHME